MKNCFPGVPMKQSLSFGKKCPFESTKKGFPSLNDLAVCNISEKNHAPFSNFSKLIILDKFFNFIAQREKITRKKLQGKNYKEKITRKKITRKKITRKKITRKKITFVSFLNVTINVLFAIVSKYQLFKCS